MATVEELELNAPKKMKRTAFFYTPAESVFMNFNPVTRIMIGGVLNFLPFAFYFSALMVAGATGTRVQLLPGIIVNVAVILTAFLLLKIANFSMRQLKTFSMLFVILTITLTISYVLLGTWSGASIYLYNIGPFPIYKENVIRFVETWTRFVSGIISVLFILSTCDERDFVKTMGHLHFPYPLTFIIATAIRGLTTFYDDYMLIKSAQESRGLDFDSMNIFRKALVYSTILVPLFMVEFNRAEDMANAIDSRAFSIRGSKHRTDYITSQSHFIKIDYLIIIASVVLMGHLTLSMFFGIDLLALSIVLFNQTLGPLTAPFFGTLDTIIIQPIMNLFTPIWTLLTPFIDGFVEAWSLPS